LVSVATRFASDKSHYGELPPGWAWCQLDDLCDVVRGGSPRPAGSELFYNGSFPFLKVADLTRVNGKFIESAEYSIKEAGLNKTREIDVGTLLLTNSGATLGVPKISRIKATINDGIAAFLYLDDKLIPYLYWYLESKTQNMREINQGMGQPNLNTNIIKALAVPIPPLTEQQCIVAAIESAFAIIDEIEAAKDDLQNAVAAAKSKILSLAISGKLVPQDSADEPASVLLERIRAEREQLVKAGKIKRGKDEKAVPVSDDNSYYEELPESWVLVTLEELTNQLNLNDGDWILSENMCDSSNNKLIQLGSIGKGVYVDKGFKYISDETFEILKCKEIHTGYLLINRLVSNGLSACILPEIGGRKLTTVDTCWIAPSEHYNLKYLLHVILSDFFQEAVLSNIKGSTRFRISKGNLIKICFPLPPLAEQQRIVGAIETTFEQLDRIEAILN